MGTMRSVDSPPYAIRRPSGEKNRPVLPGGTGPRSAEPAVCSSCTYRMSAEIGDPAAVARDREPPVPMAAGRSKRRTGIVEADASGLRLQARSAGESRPGRGRRRARAAVRWVGARPGRRPVRVSGPLRRIRQHHARFADVAQPQLRIALEAALEQLPQRRRRVGRQRVQSRRCSQHGRERCR